MAHDKDIMFMLGEIKAEQRATNEHLAKLNGKVAGHEMELGAIRLAAAKFGGIVIAVTGLLGFAWVFLAEYIKMRLGL